jgi:hypothetical protein
MDNNNDIQSANIHLIYEIIIQGRLMKSHERKSREKIMNEKDNYQ